MSPFLQTRGGGSAQGYKSSGGGGLGLTQATAAINAWDLIQSGQTANGYYWIKGTGTTGNARQFYCILDSNWMSMQSNIPNIGNQYGWIISCNHDAQKYCNSGHNPRPTSYSSHVGGDNGLAPSGGMWTNKSFSQDMSNIPFRIMMHFVYGSVADSPDGWLNAAPQGYYYCGWNSDQTIPNQIAWQKTANWSSGDYYLLMNGSSHQRRLYDNNRDSYDYGGMGVLWNSGGGSPNHVGNGSGGSMQYPNYVSSGGSGWNSGSGSSSCFSWHDTNNYGWDDWQDGAGMGDTWDIENVGANAYRGNPSAIAFH